MATPTTAAVSEIGLHTVSAVYSGDGNFDGNTSGNRGQRII